MAATEEHSPPIEIPECEVELEQVHEKEIESEVPVTTESEKAPEETKSDPVVDMEIAESKSSEESSGTEPRVLISPEWDALPEKWNSVSGVSVCSDKNKRYRRTMEDSHVCIDNFNGVPENGYFAIYDGHGGREAVEFVAEHLHENIVKEMKNTNDVAEAIKIAYYETDEEIGRQNINYSGTTSVSCLILKENAERTLYVANCGDARAVLCRGGKALRLTVDHKANDPDEIQRIRNAGGFVVMNRVNGILAVTRSLGDRSMKEFVTGEPFTASFPLTSEDSHLIIACDGVWDVLDDQAACDIVVNEPVLKRKAERLVGHSLKGGSTDNISVIVIVL